MKRGMFAVLVFLVVVAVAQPASAFHRRGCRASHCGGFFAGRHAHGGCPYGGCGHHTYPGAYASVYGQFASFYPNPPWVAYNTVRPVAPPTSAGGYRPAGAARPAASVKRSSRPSAISRGRTAGASLK